ESDDAAFDVANRKDQAVDEIVVRAALAVADEGRLAGGGRVGLLAGQPGDERLPARGRIAEPKLRRRFRGEAAALEVLAHVRAASQLLRVEALRQGVDRVEALLLGGLLLPLAATLVREVELAGEPLL